MAGIHLCTIDSLRLISEKNMETRRNEADRVRELIEIELGRCLRRLNRTAADIPLARLHIWAEQVRERELDRALKRLGNVDPRTCEVIEDLSRVLSARLLVEATLAVRRAAETGAIDSANQLVHAITGTATTSIAEASPTKTPNPSGDDACIPKSA